METSAQDNDDLVLNPEVVTKILADFIKDGVSNAGFSKAVIGLSGGVDSALCAYLAVRGLGAENVRGVLMPYKTSSAKSKEDAKRVVDALGIAHETVEITPMVDAYLSVAGTANQLRAGNVMARQRMIVLYDISSREQALVLGTSNKTEMLLGYGTLFGDLACALNPLGDLYKTQVWQLAAALGVPREIVEKKPSADLWEGQTDEGDFGFTYGNVDRLLHHAIDERQDDQQLVAMGFDIAFIQTVRTMIRKSQFKRRPPVIAKISRRTVNVDFRYARDWGI